MSQKDRDYFVVATKYSLYDNQTNPNASGNNRKNMMRSVEGSLRRLQTDFIDVLYLHIVSQGNILATLMGWTPFIALQVEYSLLQRTPERELIPMARHFGMTLTPWAPLAGGALSGKYLRGEKGRIKPESKRLDDRSKTITEAVIKIAEELHAAPAHVALQRTRTQDISCIPIVGATKPEQLAENLKCLDVHLTTDQLDRLDKASAIDLGFPGEFFKEEGVRTGNYGGFYNRIKPNRGAGSGQFSR